MKEAARLAASRLRSLGFSASMTRGDHDVRTAFDRPVSGPGNTQRTGAAVTGDSPAGGLGEHAAAIGAE
jgi:hypothetical protein